MTSCLHYIFSHTMIDDYLTFFWYRRHSITENTSRAHSTNSHIFLSWLFPPVWLCVEQYIPRSKFISKNFFILILGRPECRATHAGAGKLKTLCLRRSSCVRRRCQHIFFFKSHPWYLVILLSYYRYICSRNLRVYGLIWAFETLCPRLSWTLRMQGLVCRV